MGPFHIAVAWVLQRKPKVFFHEITPVKTDRLCIDLFSELYHVVTEVVCPSELGIPKTRARRLTVGWLKESVASSGSVQEFRELFDRKVGRTCNQTRSGVLR